jgi:beta-galactosidase GanA
MLYMKQMSSALYQAIAEHVVDKLGLKTDSVHLDITSFHVDGEYARTKILMPSSW